MSSAVAITSVSRFDSGARTAGALQKQASLSAASLVRLQCGRCTSHISTAPTRPPSICAVMYGNTLSPGNTPAMFRPSVTAGFRCAPLTLATQYTATNTATAQPLVIASQPAP